MPGLLSGFSSVPLAPQLVQNSELRSNPKRSAETEEKVERTVERTSVRLQRI